MISNIFIIIGVTLFISKLIITQFNKNKPTKINVNNPNYCILVPARNESHVIEELLLSIKSQTQKVPFENVYIMDKTNFSVNKLRKILEGKDMSQGIIIYDKEKEIGDKIYRIIRDMDEFTNYKKIVELKSERIIFDEIYLIY